MDRIKKLQELIDESPADSFLKHALALEYVKMGDDGKARIVFEEVLKHDSKYIGSYYHLGKLFERANENGTAIDVYKKGMEIAHEINDRHSYNELRSALEFLNDEI